MYLIPTLTTYVGPILPAPPMDNGLTEDDSIVPINTPPPSQEHEFVQTMDKYIQLFIHVVTLHTVCINVI